MDYNAVWMFVKIVDAGSFSRASRELGIPKSTLSKKLFELEKSLRSTLLKRTTRSLHLTEIGKQYYQGYSKAFSAISDVETEAQLLTSEPSGHLRVTMPIDLAQSEVNLFMTAFLTEFPKITLELVLTDQELNMVNDNIDIAIRTGDLESSSLKARRIGYGKFQIFASPTYLKKNPKIRTPTNLKEHNCLLFAPRDHAQVWELTLNSKKIKIPIRGRFLSNNMGSLRAMAVQGLGIALLPTAICKSEIQSNLLEVVLSDWSAKGKNMSFVYQNHKFLSPKISAFLDFMENPLKGLIS